jgi:hypothetical protein
VIVLAARTFSPRCLFRRPGYGVQHHQELASPVLRDIFQLKKAGKLDVAGCPDICGEPADNLANLRRPDGSALRLDTNKYLQDVVIDYGPVHRKASPKAATATARSTFA